MTAYRGDEVCLVLGRNLDSVFRNTLGGIWAFLNGNKKCVFADGNHIFSGQSGFGDPFVIEKGAVGAAKIFDHISTVLPGDGRMFFGSAQVVDLNITVAIAPNSDHLFIGFQSFQHGIL